MTDKKFDYAGVSLYKGKTKIRWANDPSRIKLLAKQGHEKLDLIALPEAMSKAHGVRYLQSIDYGSTDLDIVEALKYTARKNPL
jgi:hypothetical protein